MLRRIFRKNRSHFTDRENGVTPFSFESRLRYNTSADDGYKRQRLSTHSSSSLIQPANGYFLAKSVNEKIRLKEKFIGYPRNIYSRWRKGERCGWKNFFADRVYWIDSSLKFEYIFIFDFRIFS